MVDYTDDYSLLKLGAGDTLATDNYAFGTTNMDIISRVLRLGAETHVHNGAASAGTGSDIDLGNRALSLVAGTDAGSIPAGVRAYYKFSLVVDGFESDLSTEVYVDTPSPVATPSAPTLATATTGGVLLPGNYYYVLTAYTGTNTQETRGLNTAYVSVPPGTSTNTVTLTLPALPSGATGYNIYRKKPGGVRYDYLTSVTAVTPYLDDGSVVEDCNRTIPAANYTSTQNHVDVTLTGDALAPGSFWRLYRTYTADDYVLSRIAETVSTTTVFDDLGAAGTATPPSASLVVASPSKIDLTDAAEISGALPMGMVPHCFEVAFEYDGALQVINNAAVWTCEFPAAEIVCVRASLGRGSVPASTPVIVDIERGPSSATPTFTTIFTTQANRPTVPVGHMRGARATPAVTTLAQGDCLAMNIEQTGGGASPTDSDLTVVVSLIVYGYPTTTSYVAGASGGATGAY